MARRTDDGPSRRAHSPRRALLLGLLAGALLATACTTNAVSESASPSETSAAPDETANEEGTKVDFDPAAFVDPTLDTNPYHPLSPGTQWVYGGTTLVGDREVPHEIIVTITDVIREIDGAPSVAMLSESTDSGEISQVGMDYMALDMDSNVWILGGYTEEFEGGEYTNTESAWLGTADGQRVGILVPGVVTMDTPTWFIAGAPDESPSIGTPVEVDAMVCVEFDCFEAVHIIQEGEVGAPDNENKYYAPGVGVVNNVPLDASLHQDRFELLNFSQLTPEGIAEASQTVLDLEAHALQTASDVFGSAPASIRVGQ